ncbi:MAG: LptF/LptG family permease [Gemmatimonas sp.]|jgi:lipopolysaccharide export system permease protein|uniref:LptF/LptG family permease n=1 Tax=Gemmatimonas sp. TaxID=1962908 RepID=UPI0022CA2FBC|nr:LptF/LptG family permease [Gemmatimonas sp.]MCA2984858.1 LptF/LptG family permease [Gemmatimonas sp.]MCA2988615.1 LptF/LptG family permease [Gemmatimonas sp.]MCE2955335.1 LptF/LptG family permease [Gemmatimonas sp.]MCZ8012408.1 LptF/LptG family permease [Gemmatimonas sp.]MCZ8266663.1 LptF/LptG family permease [Gemmatimonas sp.]
MSTRLITPLDKYIAGEFTRIFSVTIMGFPVLVFVIDLVDNLRKYQEKGLTAKALALSYLYWIPDTLFMIMPAAVLFATVFSIGTFTRYSEITAAKASGISFYRFIAPIVVMATFAMGLDLVFSEVAPPANAERLKLLAGTSSNAMDDRYNFAFASDEGRVYRVYTLSVREKTLNDVEIEERGGPRRPGLLISAKRGHWTAQRGWTLQSGVLHVIPNETADLAFSFDSLVDRRLKETPQELRATERDPAEMRFAELTRFIKALERSGADVNTLKVERMLKIAIPVTCLIIALFGAPLATSSQRGGAAYGIAVSLATTVFFLVLIQLTKAIGGKGLISPDMAAWIPNLLVGSFAIILLARVRT